MKQNKARYHNHKTNFERMNVMGVFTNEEKVQILKDVVGFKTVNDNELEVCHYFKALFQNTVLKRVLIWLKGNAQTL